MSNIDFEKDQQNVMQKTTDVQSLADQVERLNNMQKKLELEEENLKKPKKELIDQPVIPPSTSTPPPEKIKRKPPKRKKKIKLKSETTENIFTTKKGKRPNIVNFKTRKGFFQGKFKKVTVQSAPKGITLDTNQGFKEDSMKVITKTEAATKFKTRRDPLKALERKGII